MIRKLRVKFMLVTMALLICFFALFYTVSAINNNRWYIEDVSGTLKWVAKSGVFTGEKSNRIDPLLQEVYSEDSNPVVGVIVDRNGKLLSCQTLGTEETDEIDQGLIDKIRAQPSRRKNYRSYVFSIQKLKNGNELIVLQDTSDNTGRPLRIIASILLVAFGLLALALLTFFLSRFITEPARKALEREKQFVSDASHELKTPVSAISVNAQALDIDRSDIHLRNILTETERLNYLIEKLLTLSRLQEVPLQIRDRCSLSNVVKEMALTYESVAFENGITYQYDIAEGITILGDEDELRQLLAILIDNAIKYADSPGLISISLYQKGNHPVLEISNTGKGIPEEDTPHLFERFYTGNRSRSNQSFGLGLPIAKTIVDRHGGMIEISSVINEETNVTIFF